MVECYVDVVLETEEDCFEGAVLESGVLKVQDEMVNDYKTTAPWNRFGRIMGFNEETVVIPMFAEEEGAEIYSIDGRRLNAPQKGVNILRTNQGVKKVVGR